ncbi:unnamed protein product [Psylliodes chrysocephalus]|uniref:Uncharacterized protein n=1 Tax=Psylliodes chrysocephalus TaxID=3402493 RepID=A0A9P0CMY8_9CUCU|nr:unnamed protein product [Psylliodes chrysocephala]
MPKDRKKRKRRHSTSSSSSSSSGDESRRNWKKSRINSTKHRVTNYTPAELLFGFPLKMNNDVHDSESEDNVDVTTIRKRAAKRLEQNIIKQDITFNKKRSPPKMYKVGDLVLTKVISNPATGESKKLLPKFRGPFKIIEVLPNDRYRVKEDLHTGRSKRPYEGVVDWNT